MRTLIKSSALKIYILFLFALIPLLPLHANAATPLVDDTTFISSDGVYKSPTGDLDLLILRENYIVNNTSLTQFDNPDPLEKVISGNYTTFDTPDCVQSLLLRIYDAGEFGWIRGSAGKITIKDGPLSDVSILGVISDIYDYTQPDGPSQYVNLNDSDDIFQSLNISNVLDDPPWRTLEDSSWAKDTIYIYPSRKEIDFTMKTGSGSDDLRILLDYGYNNCSGLNGFPEGVRFDVQLADNIMTSKGIKVGNKDYGEAIYLLDVSLTSTASVTAKSPIRIPDINYFANTRARDTNKNYGGDDDNTGIYYFVVDSSLKDNVIGTPDFYIWIMDADDDANLNPSISGTDDMNADGGKGTLGGDSVFEYILYGGVGAKNNEDVIGGGDVPDIGIVGEPTDDFTGTLIDINSSDPIRNTLRTDLDNMLLIDQDWTVIGVDMDGNPGDVIQSTDGMLTLFGTGKYVYKLIVDGRDVRGIAPVGTAEDFNAYQVDISTSNIDANTGDCTYVRPVNNCLVPFAYELIFDGRPDLAGAALTTHSLILVPELLNNRLDIQSLDLDEGVSWGPTKGINGFIDMKSQISLPDSTVYNETQTYESGTQRDNGFWMWTSFNQVERNQTTEIFPSSKDGKTCGPGPFAGDPLLCYSTVNNENSLWQIEIDPVELNNPFGLRVLADNGTFLPLPLIPTTVCPDTDGDGVPDCVDNCPQVPNSNQADVNINGIGDACEACSDPDNDGICDDGDGNGLAGDLKCTGGNTLNCDDNCPNSYNPNQEDQDGDKIGDVCDNCACIGCQTITTSPKTITYCTNGNCANPNQEDVDTDGVGDVCDNCSGTPNLDQVDTDLDGVGNTCDNCLSISNSDQADSDICQGVNDPLTSCTAYGDPAKDRFGDACDNCKYTYNPTQQDSNGNGIGDACEPLDSDGDGIPDGSDNCPNIYNPQANIPDVYGQYISETCADNVTTNATSQCNFDGDDFGDKCDKCPFTNTLNNADADNDGDGDICDNCPGLGETCYNGNCANPGQEDTDMDGIGDVCDSTCGYLDDADGDGVWGCHDNCPTDPNPNQEDCDNDNVGNICDGCKDNPNPDQLDSDDDGKQDACDNCPNTPNTNQADTDHDGRGDACDTLCPTNPSPTCMPIPVECEVHPETINKDSSGQDVLLEIEFEKDDPYIATNIVVDTNTFIQMRFPEPTPGGCLASVDTNGEHYLNHNAGTEQYGLRKLHAKFDRGIIQSCINVSLSPPPAKPDHQDIELRISGKLNDGNDFTCSDEVWVIDTSSSD